MTDKRGAWRRGRGEWAMDTGYGVAVEEVDVQREPTYQAGLFGESRPVMSRAFEVAIRNAIKHSQARWVRRRLQNLVDDMTGPTDNLETVRRRLEDVISILGRVPDDILDDQFEKLISDAYSNLNDAIRRVDSLLSHMG